MSAPSAAEWLTKAQWLTRSDALSRDRFASTLVYATIVAITLVPLHIFWLAVFVGLIAAGIVILATDSAMRRMFLGDPRPRLAALLILGIVAWEVVGVLFRGTGSSSKAWQAAGNALAILTFGVVVLTALRRDPDFPRRLLLVAAFVLAGATVLAIIGQVVIEWPTFVRLHLYGRANGAIFSAGALIFGVATALTAALAERGRLRLALFAAAAISAVGFVLTFSRGPIVAAFLAAAVLAIAVRLPAGRKGRIVAALAIFAAVAAPALLVLNEAALQDIACGQGGDICRKSYRMDIWSLAAQSIAEHPWLGAGPTAEIENPFGRHPHNGYLGPAFYFGIPAALAFFAMIINSLAATLTDIGATRGNGQASSPAGRLARLSLFLLVFSLVYMVTDLSDAFTFVNAHFLFFWLPAFLTLSPTLRGTGEGLAAETR
ncbi:MULTISPECIES: O-antigen ligase family protein [unclassified Chelatococcus]|uniref:O-antigen ligase family protein n=1 Tax=unclassified Chelatococcus TaxID=2638111 RepID=UPI001BCE2602|nr:MULTISPECIES: O-antigen ligase family protein [unclassified Chelatococcus]CAH1667696.1 O-antigen ligase-like membrane protein [Hyphomicrobiales bacterium]MBS7738059.1 O-antigen ligase family protein [Chelatococcus sp. HY11]MBX3546302.1 O-antigen ligase family protein [Chelatococcus sp.]MCO5077596.1 O-antigen ligase family protein [Chelatococcus sp.]CAH1679494.1 O-antigen ligase-like membrane protein [Hyphomicrobiales bacterium]